jgi:hypothetical protein
MLADNLHVWEITAYFLSGILTIKAHVPDSCAKSDPTKEMLEKAKKATTSLS